MCLFAGFGVTIRGMHFPPGTLDTHTHTLLVVGTGHRALISHLTRQSLVASHRQWQRDACVVFWFDLKMHVLGGDGETWRLLLLAVC